MLNISIVNIMKGDSIYCLRVLLSVVILTIHLPSLASFCEKRSYKITQLQQIHSFENSLQDFKKAAPDLIVFGEPHQSYILNQLPEILKLLTNDLNCAFVEFPHDVPQVDFQMLIRGHNTNYFRTEASFDYVPLLSWLISNNIKIIPVDDSMAKNQPPRSEALSWLTRRDEVMLKNIKNNLKQCEKSVFLVGKHHLTPDVANYKETLGHKLKELLKDKVAIVDLTVPRNFQEEYCSPAQNSLFKTKSFIPTNSLNDVEYSLFVSNSYWSDFDWSLYLPAHH